MSNAASRALQNPAIATIIVGHARPFDRAALCRTMKALAQPAERLLYAELAFDDPSIAFLAFQVLAQTPRLAQHVRTLQLYYRPRTRTPVPLPQQFWRALALALMRTAALEVLTLSDMSGAGVQRGETYTAVLPLDAPFRLREAKLCLPWDAHMAAFVARQPRLALLQVAEVGARLPPAPPAPPLPPGALPALRVFDGPLHVAAQLEGPLTHVQVYVEAGADAVAACAPLLAHAGRTLRALNVLDVPEARVPELMRRIAAICPTLKHLGSVAMHPTLRTSFQDALLSFSHLQSLELDLGLWNPQPPLTLQRALVAEVHMYGPELRTIVLWVASMRIVWQLNEITSVWEGRAEPPGQRAGWQTV